MSTMASTMLKYARPLWSTLASTTVRPTLLAQAARSVSGTQARWCEAAESSEEPARDPAKDRTQHIPVETSIRYMQSDAYKATYGDNPVWTRFRRNHKGGLPPRRTRKTCIRKGVISTGSPCPVCRDEYLVLDHRNTHLLHQFISPHNGEILSYERTNLCQRRHKQLLVEVERARDLGLLTFDVPHRHYDYTDYYVKEESA